MKLSDSELLARLTEAIALGVPSIYGKDSHLDSVPPVELHRRYSFIFRYWVKLSDGKAQPILVKIPHDYWMTSLQEAMESDHIQDVVRSEFETLTTIADAIHDSDQPSLTAIRPRVLLLEFNALVMDEIPIRMLKTELSRVPIILGSQKGWQDFESYLQASGEWLKVIHEKFSANPPSSLAQLGVMGKVKSQLSVLHDSYDLSLSQLHDLFERLFDCVKLVDAPFGSLHNDFHPGNIFITKDGNVGALDPNWVESGPTFDDLASMMIYPETGKMQILMLGLRFRPLLRRRYQQAFLRGYFGTSQVPLAALYFLCAADILEKWCDIEKILISSSSKVYRYGSWLLLPWIRFYFRRLITVYLTEGIRTAKAL